ncbi:tyrosine-type recombinase/integrase [Clostridium sp. JS66]|uniref:tyrosine-type recombinase/integrase n=1 Tax=Clostridium sp. JS66 TaxID=3064705 RepID=UPI00298E2497|nr:tyrosine-type recombinase/integrase [Clostridium sp. JS66]WPC42391.1 tyrosine-type recombinase/integrase [Clostridium sp. JS66]
MANVIVLNYLQLEYELENDYDINKLKTENYIERLKIVDKLPFNKGTIYFSENLWDFSQYTALNVPKNYLIFNFKLCPDEFKDDLKAYVLIRILENNNKIQSIHRKFEELHKFFRFIISENIFSVYDINASKINKYINKKDFLAPKSMKLLKDSIKNFYEFYSANYKDLMTSDIKNLFKEGDNNMFKNNCEKRKYPNIPDEYFNTLIKHILSVIDNKNEKLELRATACILLIISQTGLRISELLELHTHSIKEITLFNGEKRHYLEYKTWKRENGNNAYAIENTFINDLSQKGFQKLITLHQKNREDKKTDLLYVPSRAKILPVQSTSFNKSMLSFFSYYGEDLDAIDSQDKYPNLKTTQIHDKYFFCLHPDSKTLTYPVTPQYRVRVCTDLYNKGIPLEYIRKFMGHLTSAMEGYYVRPNKNQVQEDITFSKKVLKDIVSGDVTLLGSNANEFSERLKEFLKVNKYNIATNIEEIVETLSKTIPIRNKTGGVCIKSSPLRECSKDAMTNELYCAYGVCPNIFHFFYMSEVSYRQGKELLKTITINIERGHRKQVQKELNMLKMITTQKIIPELNELEKELLKKGAQRILLEYPDLVEIVENFDSIYKEVKSWINLKESLSIN